MSLVLRGLSPLSTAEASHPRRCVKNLLGKACPPRARRGVRERCNQFDCLFRLNFSNLSCSFCVHFCTIEAHAPGQLSSFIPAVGSAGTAPPGVSSLPRKCPQWVSLCGHLRSVEDRVPSRTHSRHRGQVAGLHLTLAPSKHSDCHHRVLRPEILPFGLATGSPANAVSGVT